MSDFTADEVRVLKALAAGLLNASAGGSSSSPNGSSGESIPDSKLDADWADKVVSKDPARWSGESMVGRKYSDCPAEWHDAMASFCDWKAGKGKSEVPVRLNNKGEPWWKSDEFNAKLSRGWAKRLRARGSQTVAARASDAEDAEDVNDDQIPF